MDLKEILVSNYMPYAKGVITGRAIPSIDGFKPVVRRILYTMHKNNVYKENKKSQAIVGDTMKIHPNGDSAIYDALIRLTTGHGALNVPYIKSKGNFGKFYSRNIYPAAPRYTEARLNDGVAELLFDGIDENAVDLVPNYDSTTVEPKLLPVKFPNIIVNDTEGIAVAMSSSIPCFGLVEACKAAAGIMDGTITNIDQLADVLVAPEFPTGGTVHMNPVVFRHILANGKGSITMTGTAEVYNNKIIITQVPYGVKIEDVIKAINDDQDTFSGVSKAVNLTGKDGMKVEITLKRGVSSDEVYQRLVRYTKFRSTISYNTSVIIDGECYTEMSMLDLLTKWVEFRLNTIKRVYEYRLSKKQDKEQQLLVWEKINGHIKEVAEILTQQTEEVATVMLKQKFSLTDNDVNALMNMPIKSLTTDKVIAKLNELAKTRKEIIEVKAVIDDEAKRREISIGELNAIIKKFGTKKATDVKEPLVLVDKEPEVISDSPVRIVITRNFNIKRLLNLDTEPKEDENDPIIYNTVVTNDTYLCVFTSDGYCYKIAVNDIDCNTRTTPNVFIRSMFSSKGNGKIVYVTPLNNADRCFTMLHGDARFDIVNLDRFVGNRTCYKNAITPDDGPLIGVTYDSFFVITDYNRAVILDARETDRNRLISKPLARLKPGESIVAIKAVESLTNEIDLNFYRKSYFVKIRDDLS